MRSSVTNAAPRYRRHVYVMAMDLDVPDPAAEIVLLAVADGLVQFAAPADSGLGELDTHSVLATCSATGSTR